MVAMSYFCHQNVSQISLEIVANCSHPSEILALGHNKALDPAIDTKLHVQTALRRQGALYLHREQSLSGLGLFVLIFRNLSGDKHNHLEDSI